MLPAGIALGSNLGDRLGHLRIARDRLLDLHEGTAADFLVSPLFETEPVDCAPGTAAFFNAVIELHSSLEPLDLLEAAQSIERDLGRASRRPKNAPRTIDVDLLYLGDRMLADDRLDLPHPRLLSRRFVLTPLAAIRPGLVLPGETRPIATCLRELDSPEPEPTLARSVW